MTSPDSAVVDVSFRVQGSWVPADHGYALFGAISRIAPELHADESIGVHPLLGRPVADRRLSLLPTTRLSLRLSADRLPKVLPLAGQTLELDGAKLLVGVPEVQLLRPAAMLRSRLVVIKGYTEPDSFADAARRQLQLLGIHGEVQLPSVRAGTSLEGHRSRVVGAPIRRTLAIHGRQIVGFPVHVTTPQPGDSIRLQAAGLGGRRRFGCGIFVPAVDRE